MGIIGLGAIARKFAVSCQRARGVVLESVAAREPQRANDFAREWGVKRFHADYQSLIQDPDIDGVYIALPHPFHKEWAVRAADAGKHILCEKPMGMNQIQVEEMIAAARKRGVFLMECFLYRYHPQTRKMIELIRDGKIGEVKFIHVVHTFNSPQGSTHRLFDRQLGGGSILDLGCYVVSMARLIAGAKTGDGTILPDSLKATGSLSSETHIDEWAAAQAIFPGPITAQFIAGLKLRAVHETKVIGTQGSIELSNPFLNLDQTAKPFLRLESGANIENFEFEILNGFTLAVEYLANAVSQGVKNPEYPHPSWEDSLANAKTLDRWRRAVGVTYREDATQG